MEVSQLIYYFPRLYHMTESGTWQTIRELGLLSTTAVLDFFAVSGNKRLKIESERRPESLELSHADYGTVVIRDQKPLNEKRLSQCLDDGMSPADWYRILNAKVFFWLSWKRVEGLLAARAYRDRMHSIIIIDTERLLEEYTDKVSLARINTGSTIMSVPRRGVGTFQSISDYPFDYWRKKRGPQRAVAELAVDYQVSDVSDLVVRVEHWKVDRLIEVVWTP